MIKINLKDILKKWIPIFVIVSIIVLMMGLIFHSSFPQIISSIVVSVLLIFSAMFFKSVGRDRENKRSNFDSSKSDSEFR
jgi:uncharacterized membrane protein